MAEAAPHKIDLNDAEGLKYWQDKFGVTEEQLRESVQAVGEDPAAITEHLLNQGSSAGPS